MQGGGSADITFVRSAGNRVLGAGVNLMFGTSFTDLCYGYNAFWRRCLPHLQITCDGFEVETVLNVRAAKAGFTIVEVPSYEQSRIHGLSNLNAWRDGKRVLKTIMRERFSALPEPSDAWKPQFAEFDEQGTTSSLEDRLGYYLREAGEQDDRTILLPTPQVGPVGVS
jgi:hypothetical protein